MSRPVILGAIMIAVLILACGSVDLTGNSSETTNGLTVVVRAGVVEGKAPPYSSLYLIEKTYDPLSGVVYGSVPTDSTGEFLFTAAQGGYNLFCHDTNGLWSRVPLTLKNKVSSEENKGEGDTLFDTLRLPGSIQGYVPGNQNAKVSYLYLEGSPFFTIADESGYFRIDGIPGGRYTIRLFFINNISSPVTYSDTLSFELTSVINVINDSVLTIELE